MKEWIATNIQTEEVNFHEHMDEYHEDVTDKLDEY